MGTKGAHRSAKGQRLSQMCAIHDQNVEVELQEGATRPCDSHVGLRGRSQGQARLTPSVDTFSCNSVKSGGPTSISDIVSNNFTVGSGRKVRCARGMIGKKAMQPRSPGCMCKPSCHCRRALHWVPISMPMPMGFGWAWWAWVRYYWWCYVGYDYGLTKRWLPY